MEGTLDLDSDDLGLNPSSALRIYTIFELSKPLFPYL